MHREAADLVWRQNASHRETKVVPTPLGLHAPRLEAVRALLGKRGRRDQGRYAVEGRTMLAEAVEAGLVPAELYVTQWSSADENGPLAAFEDRLFIVPERTMTRLSDLEAPPGIVGIFPVVLDTAAALLERGEAVAVLAGISDPGNAGTLLRTAEIFGIGSAIFAGDAVEPHNPKVVRSTMGAIFRMRVATSSAEELLTAARAADYTIVAATRDGIALSDYRFPERPLITIGSERHGVSHVLPHHDQAVAIPHKGRGESLNAAIAGGIIFYAFSQQSERRI